MAKENNSQTNTIVGPNTVVQGNLTVKGSVLVYGKVYGDVHSEGLVRTTKDSLIKGAVVAEEAVIEGDVDGSLTIKGRATLGGSARLVGNVQVGTLVIEEGAQFTGKCEMRGAKIDAAPVDKDGQSVEGKLNLKAKRSPTESTPAGPGDSD